MRLPMIGAMEMTKPTLERKSALVTGASRGIGKAIALCFAQEGCEVAVNYVCRGGGRPRPPQRWQRLISRTCGA